MPLPPKPVSATIRYDDESFVSIRSNGDGTYRYHYWGQNDDDEGIDLIAKNDRNAGLWSAMMAVVVMAQVPKGDV